MCTLLAIFIECHFSRYGPSGVQCAWSCLKVGWTVGRVISVPLHCAHLMNMVWVGVTFKSNPLWRCHGLFLMIDWSVSKLCTSWNCRSQEPCQMTEHACLLLHSLALHQIIRCTMAHQNRNGKFAGVVCIGSDHMPHFASSRLLSHILCGR